MDSGEKLASRVLVVEGRNDKYVVQNLCDALGYKARFKIEYTNGYDQFMKGVSLRVKGSEYEVIGYMVDANGSLKRRWQAISDRLKRVGITVPKNIAPEGTIIRAKPAEGKPRVGVWLMPNNSRSGQLEDFVTAMIPDDDLVWELAGDYIERVIEQVSKPEFRKSKNSRARLYAWLATRKEPPRMGEAIKYGDVNVDGELATKFIDWLRELYD